VEAWEGNGRKLHSSKRQRDNNDRKQYKYVCITTYQPDTKSHPNPNPYLNPSPSPSTEQHRIVNIQLNIVTRPTCPAKFIRDNVVAPSVRLQVVIVTLLAYG